MKADKCVVAELVAAMREADEQFEHVGGSTRHYVYDCLLPALARRGLKLVQEPQEIGSSEATGRSGS